MRTHLILLLGTACLGFTNLKAQNWVNGGNTLSANGTIGTNSSHSLLFETSGVERGRITNGGNWAIGSTGTPSKFTVNSASGVSPFRAQIAGGTKLIVNGNGGVSIGTFTAGPSNGLYVVGDVGIGTALPAKKLQIQDGDVRMHSTTSTSRYLEFLKTTSGIDWRIGHVGNFFDIYSSTNDFATTSLRAYFESPATTNGFVFHVLGRSVGNEWVVSDARFKKDVKGLESSIGLIKRLQPKTFYFKNTEFAGLGLPAEKQYGFIAQELEEVLPELVANTEITVKVDANGERQKEKVKVINYTEIIPLLVKAMQEQEQRMEQLQQHIEIQQQHYDELKKELVELKLLINQATNNLNISTINNSSTLLQNIPNPARDLTRITYSLPEGITSAQLLITDALGRSIRQLPLSTSGVINIDVSALAKGVYNYSLIVDNKTMITKKMTVVK